MKFDTLGVARPVAIVGIGCARLVLHAELFVGQDDGA